MGARRGLLAMLTYLEYDEPAEGRIDEKADAILSTIQVYFIDELEWGEEKCMITGLTLDIRKGEVIACPKCGGYGKKSEMDKWLEENNNCPRCRRKLTKEDCPKVMIRENRK